MARIEWVKQRLNNWALWKAREAGGGLGFATQSVLLAERIDRYREVDISSTIDSTDAALTNQGIEALKPDQVHLHSVLHCIYLQDTGIRGAAVRLGKAESTIKANLEQADRFLELWFRERAEKRKKSLST